MKFSTVVFTVLVIGLLLGVNLEVQAEETTIVPETQLSCGNSTCNKNETCVTWIKQSDSTNGTQQTNEEYKECFLDDGQHETKMDPKSLKLCAEDEVYTIIREPQPCLKDKPPCPLTWKYKCGKSSDKAHSCEQRSCPSGYTCTELLACDLDPPCVTKALCTVGGRSLDPK